MNKRAFDRIGITSSVLCLIHCLIVPIGLLITPEVHALHHWAGWTILQIVFIAIATWAVFHAVKHIHLPALKWLLWSGIVLLIVALFLEHSTAEILNYIAAGVLIAAHSLNLFSQHRKLSTADSSS